MTKKEYGSLSKKEKLESLEKQAVLDNKLEIQRIQSQMQTKKFQHELQLQQNKQVYDFYKRNKTKIVVTISGGDFKNMRRGYYIAPFELVKNEVKRISVYSLQNNNFHHYLWVTYQDLGLHIGVRPHKQYERVDKYISSNTGYFKKLSYDYKPAVIIINHYAEKIINKNISFIGPYDANNLNVSIYVKDKRREFYQ